MLTEGAFEQAVWKAANRLIFEAKVRELSRHHNAADGVH
jgi:hypothetical protein